VKSYERATYLVKQSRWQKAEIVSAGARDLSQIVSRPDEFVSLIDNHPRPVVIESQVAFHHGGKFDSTGGIRWHPVRNRQHGNKSRAVLVSVDAKNDHTRPVLAPLFLTGTMLVVPEVGKVEN
jgi:hypothetical protein